MKRRVALTLSMLCGCPADDAPSDTDGATTGDESTSSTSLSTSGASTSSTTATTTESSDSGSSESGPIVGCGNGELEEGEQCDDGNQVDDDACSNECIPACGLRWELVLPEGAAVDMITATEDGNVRVGGIAMGRGAPMLYHELVDDSGASLESEMLDVGFVDAPATPWMAPLGARGSYLFGAQDVGNGLGTRVVAFDDDAMVAWDVEPEPAIVDEPIDRGIAIAPDGDPVVAGAVTVAKGDDDIWVAKLSARDGSTVWTGTHSGPNVGGFSTDDGGPVAVAGDGSVYVLGLVREGLGVQDATVVKFGEGGGAPAWVNTIHDDKGAEDVFPSSIAADANGDALAAVQTQVGSTSTFEISRIGADGRVQWTFTTEQLELDPMHEIEAEDVVAPLVAFAADGTITIAATVALGVAGSDLLILRLSAEGEQLCHAYHTVDELEGDRAPAQFAVMPDGGAVVGGEGAGNDGSLEWVARFRP
jgi:cysteine-rich repeat protein